jgi:hypothetical protein
MAGATDVQAAFAKFYKAERDRSERALVDVLEILLKPGTPEAAVEATLDRLEAHWGRYGEPGDLRPLGNALADAGLADR